MSKSNKLVNVLFAGIVGMYDEFLGVEKDMGFPETDEMYNLKMTYTSLLKKHEPVIEELSRIEEVISQLRCRENIRREMRLYVSQGKYIYARTTFFQINKRIKDIRTILGVIEALGSNLNKLYQDDDFMSYAVRKIRKGMDVIIEKNILSLKSIPKHLKPIEQEI